ncbi:MAG: hypothetical protein R2822_21380 [Spirosomataceae bacterium]
MEGSKVLFMHYGGGIFPKFPKGIEDNTHFSRYGAAVMASLVVEGIMELPIDLKSFVKKSEFAHKYTYELPNYYTPVFEKIPSISLIIMQSRWAYTRSIPKPSTKPLKHVITRAAAQS